MHMLLATACFVSSHSLPLTNTKEMLFETILRFRPCLDAA